jgi:hypothetical protein
MNSDYGSSVIHRRLALEAQRGRVELTQQTRTRSGGQTRAPPAPHFPSCVLHLWDWATAGPS